MSSGERERPDSRHGMNPLIQTEEESPSLYRHPTVTQTSLGVLLLWNALHLNTNKVPQERREADILQSLWKLTLNAHRNYL